MLIITTIIVMYLFSYIIVTYILISKFHYATTKQKAIILLTSPVILFVYLFSWLYLEVLNIIDDMIR